MGLKMLMKFVLVAMLAAMVPVLAAEGAEAPEAHCTGYPGDSAELTRKLCEGDALVKKYCTSCHSEGRIMGALQEMRGSQNEGSEKELKNIIVRKIRMTNGDISRQDGRKILDYLVVVWQRQKPAAKS
jgi:mono/diheme cytochrome c family protein